MTRVLFSHPSAELYGSDRMAVETVRALVDSGDSVYVVIPEDGPLVAELSGAGATVQILRSPVIRKSAMKPLGFLRLIARLVQAIPRMFRLITSLRPDVVYVNTVIQPWWIILGRLLRAKVIVHVREAERDAPQFVRRALLMPVRAAHMVVANSKATAAQVALDARGLSAQTAVIYNGKDWAPYDCPVPQDHDGPLRVLFIGRLNPRKGPDVAIEAVGQLIHAGHAARLEIVGAVFPGYEWFEDRLRAQVADLGIEQFVTFHGFVAHPVRFLGQSDVLVVPSRVEPFGTVAAEGMASRRPVVVADVQGLVEIVTDGQTGLVTPAGDARELALALARLKSDFSLRMELAIAGAKSVRKRFSREQYMDDVVGLVNRVQRDRGPE